MTKRSKTESATVQVGLISAFGEVESRKDGMTTVVFGSGAGDRMTGKEIGSVSA